ncbi:hypothetical protein SELMODRAFT_402711 [Selaginella moellendorffii]|uniref:Uncharacterized protein n=1 Tax=Selaginella moellendorffii TaxID=88036 RepID=D8QMT5_SELML|nr:hypothetical protein SELMODRAFT_402711 [Selaginella moellendorffii]
MAEEWGFSNASFDCSKIAPSHQGVEDGGLQVLSSNMQGQELVSARFQMLDLQDHDRPLPERFTVVVLGKDRRSSLAARAESLRVDFGVVEDARTKIQAQIANAKKQPSTKKHPSAKARRSMARKRELARRQDLEEMVARLEAQKAQIELDRTDKELALGGMEAYVKRARLVRRRILLEMARNKAVEKSGKPYTRGMSWDYFFREAMGRQQRDRIGLDNRSLEFLCQSGKDVQDLNDAVKEFPILDEAGAVCGRRVWSELFTTLYEQRPSSVIFGAVDANISIFPRQIDLPDIRRELSFISCLNFQAAFGDSALTMEFVFDGAMYKVQYVDPALAVDLGIEDSNREKCLEAAKAAIASKVLVSPDDLHAFACAAGKWELDDRNVLLVTTKQHFLAKDLAKAERQLALAKIDQECEERVLELVTKAHDHPPVVEDPTPVDLEALHQRVSELEEEVRVGEQALEKLEERLAASKTDMEVGDKLARRALLEAGRLARDTGGVIFSDSVESLLEGSHAELYQAAHECGRDKLLESCEGEERWLTLHAYVESPAPPKFKRMDWTTFESWSSLAPNWHASIFTFDTAGFSGKDGGARLAKSETSEASKGALDSRTCEAASARRHWKLKIWPAWSEKFMSVSNSVKLFSAASRSLLLWSLVASSPESLWDSHDV